MKKVVLISLILLIVLFFGCVENSGLDNEVKLTNSILPPKGSDGDLFNSAVSYSDFNSCEKIVNEWVKKECQNKIISDLNISK